MVSRATAAGAAAALACLPVALASVDAEYKRRKEDFVSGHSGTTAWETALVVSMGPAALFMRRMVQSFARPGSGEFLGGAAGEFVTDFALCIIPCIVAVMVPFWGIPWLVPITLVPLARLGVSQCLDTGGPQGREASKIGMAAGGRSQFLTHYRAITMILTIIAILAVDFHVFPRRFCKAETYGKGLMDVGVGSFVLSNALVAGKAVVGGKKAGGIGGTLSWALRKAAPIAALACLGMGRLLLTKGVGYQEHVGEYGVHWNFFHTLAAVGLLTAAVPLPRGAGWRGILGAAVLFSHQAYLSMGGGAEWVMSDQRDPSSLVSLNKEGIASAAGYWGLHLLGVELGIWVATSSSAAARAAARFRRPGGAARVWWKWIGQMAMLEALLWGALLLAEHYIEPASRRSCNLAYCIWMLALNLHALLLCVVYEVVLVAVGPVRLAEAINDNQLALFLLANLLTGGVNLAIDTFEVGDVEAVAVVAYYVFTVCAVASAAQAYGLKLKFW